MITEFDFSILRFIQEHMRCVFLDFLMPIITLFGEYGIWWISVALLFMIIRSRRKCGATMAVGLIMCGVIGNILLKNIVGRDRPCWIDKSVGLLINVPHDYSFPSGHTMLCFTSAVILAFYDKKLGIPALILSAAVGFSRMYLYVHFPPDVLAGMLIGIAIGVFSALAMKQFVFERKKSLEEKTKVTV